ncbi:MAG: hypothetical protein VBE63_12570 [Lamprobacter sp.]|uniref:hypothetical protein n=1 Tax=Lamprobacter sp. TaxID=3100796 RepID=UPI002B2610C3|nr:hypothetical protein [Lamprobacter sp.]MEA3640761.1 hypothetical protein [Lamprobacter sp.]
MDRKILLSVLTGALLAFIGIWMLLSAFPDERAGIRLYPWDVSRAPSGQLQAFGLTLGESTLADLRALLGEEGKLNLFAETRPDAPDRDFTVEAYFDNILLSNLKADWVVSLAVPQDQLAGMYDRGLRASKLASGSRKVVLDPDDAAPLAEAPIRSITYLPWKSLRPEDIVGRFGEPERQLTEKRGVVHWLYPDQGLDIARDTDGGVVIQYLNPADFERALQPLEAAKAAS